MEFGTHCNYQYCKQKDFLPFSCSLCAKTYCLEHRTFVDHECPNQPHEKKAIVCPICNKTLQYTSTLSEGEVWEIHAATECDESMYQPPMKKMCPAAKCRTELKAVNTHNCRTCGQDVCMK